jgi:hypothetical protein
VEGRAATHGTSSLIEYFWEHLAYALKSQNLLIKGNFGEQSRAWSEWAIAIVNGHIQANQ